MVRISHYEVYTDRGDGWKLEDRFSSDQRQEAIRVAREKEREKVAVKIIKEDFDVQDNSYNETVEYVSGLSKKKEKRSVSSSGYGSAGQPKSDYSIVTQEPDQTPSGQNVFTAIFKLIAIIIFCLLSANILVTLLIPVIEIIAPESVTRTLLFIIFFALFILLAVPLVLKKVPWYVFNSGKIQRKKVISEKKFFDKADLIIHNYNLNDNFEPALAPAFPEAPLEYKRYMVEYLSQVISNLDGSASLQDDFMRLGIKLVIYGGCFELCRYNGLSITQANSILHEAFGIIDGGMGDVEAFYEAKRTYKDNKVAIFLTGVGAYLMSQLIDEKPLDTHILKATFEKWNSLNKYRVTANRLEELKKEPDIMFNCVVSIQNSVRFYEEAQPGDREDFGKVKGEIRNIVSNLVGKFGGNNVIEDNYITSVTFSKLNNALKFATEFYKDVEIYEDELDNENLIIDNKCSILFMSSEDEPNLSPYVQDVFEQAYAGEIITDEETRQKLADDNRFSFDFLGDKSLERTGKTVPLYKLIYE